MAVRTVYVSGNKVLISICCSVGCPICVHTVFALSFLCTAAHVPRQFLKSCTTPGSACWNFLLTCWARRCDFLEAYWLLMLWMPPWMDFTFLILSFLFHDLMYWKCPLHCNTQQGGFSLAYMGCWVLITPGICINTREELGDFLFFLLDTFVSQIVHFHRWKTTKSLFLSL
jgi:hypothetical protein